jgi:hypothetical protein
VRHSARRLFESHSRAGSQRWLALASGAARHSRDAAQQGKDERHDREDGTLVLPGSPCRRVRTPPAGRGLPSPALERLTAIDQSDKNRNFTQLQRDEERTVLSDKSIYR